MRTNDELVLIYFGDFGLILYLCTRISQDFPSGPDGGDVKAFRVVQGMTTTSSKERRFSSFQQLSREWPLGDSSLLYRKHALTGCLRAQLETKHYEEENL